MEPTNLKISEKLETLRAARILSLDDVSALTNVSKPMLVVLTKPSISRYTTA